MRKITALAFVFILLYQAAMPQVGINASGAAPAANAILDVSSSTKGVLLPRMTSAQRQTLTPSLALTVFDTDTKSYWYYNGSTWKEISGAGLQLPYADTVFAPNYILDLTNKAGDGIRISSPGEAIHAKSTNTQPGSNVIYTETDYGAGIRGISTYGYGGLFNSSNGTALGIYGKIELNYSTGDVGSILSNNKDNLPVWQAPVAFVEYGLGASNITVSSFTDTKLKFSTEEADAGSNFVSQDANFIAHVKGLYHFDATALWLSHTNGTGFVSITLRKNAAPYASVRIPAVSGKDVTTSLSIDMKLEAGDYVDIVAFQNSGANQVISRDGLYNRFTGHLLWMQ